MPAADLRRRAAVRTAPPARNPAHPKPVELPEQERAAAVLAAVAEQNRVRLLRLLLDGERCVTQCMEHTGLVQSLVSKHLRRLVDTGLVESRRSGRRNYHHVVDPDGIRELLETAERLSRSRT